MGPLQGVKVIEFAGIGPGPFCAMMLADMGAEVIRLDRKGGGGWGNTGSKFDVLNRNRRSVALDLKKPEAIRTALRLVEKVDAVQEGFRPGVMERLGLGPVPCLEHNPKLVYGRMTGWGQDGPLAQAAGHDINYIALAGALHAIGPGDRPVPPLNLVGDFGGGALYLAFGMVCALLEAQRSGQGQVVDAAMIDGTASLMQMFWGMSATGVWNDKRANNFLDGGAPFYGTYECSDGRFVTIGSLEPQFYALLLEKLGLAGDPDFAVQVNREAWPRMKEKLTTIFRNKSRDEWCSVMEGTDVCFAPVLSMAEVASHPHIAARGTVIEVDGVRQSAPAPRFSRTRPEKPVPPASCGADTRDILDAFGFSSKEIGDLAALEVI